MATAFVCGATGYTGRALVEELVRRGVHTVAHVRPDSPALATWRERFHALGAAVESTAFDEDAMAEVLSDHGVTHLFQLIGTTRRRAKAAGKSAAVSYEQVDYGLTALLVRAAARSRTDVRFVYLSSLGASPTSPLPYLRARGKAEEAVRHGGMPWVIVRPGPIGGPDREEARPLERAVAVVGDAVLDLAGVVGLRRLRDRYHSIDAHALARVLARLALDDRAAAHVFEPPYDRPVE